MKKLSWTQRIALAEGIKAGKSNAQIAREIGVHRATIGREISRNADSRENYAPQEADLRAWNRQKEAMPKRFLVTFCGVEFLSALKKRNRIYTYISRTHFNLLSRQQDDMSHAWDSFYLQSSKNRFTPAGAFMRWSGASFPAVSLNTKFFGSSALSFSSSTDITNRCANPSQSSSMPGLLKKVSSQAVSRKYLSFVPAYSHQVLYAIKNKEIQPINPDQKNILRHLCPINFKNNTTTDVSFYPKMKNIRQKTLKNLLFPSPSTLKI